jgi:hypothetical protein
MAWTSFPLRAQRARQSQYHVTILVRARTLGGRLCKFMRWRSGCVFGQKAGSARGILRRGAKDGRRRPRGRRGWQKLIQEAHCKKKQVKGMQEMEAKRRKRRTNRRMARGKNLLYIPTTVTTKKTHDKPQNSHLEADGIANDAHPRVAIIIKEENRKMSLIPLGAWTRREQNHTAIGQVISSAPILEAYTCKSSFRGRDCACCKVHVWGA